MQYTTEDKLMTYSPTINGTELQPCVSNIFQNGFPIKKNIAAKVCIFIGGGGICAYAYFCCRYMGVNKACHFSFA